jgi:tRNA(adenine34) deaminase
MTMWSTLALPWQVCIEQAWQAYCAGSIPIGACVTGSDGRVLARGRNRIFDDVSDATPHLSMTRLAHAEVNALLALDTRVFRFSWWRKVKQGAESPGMPGIVA